MKKISTAAVQRIEKRLTLPRRFIDSQRQLARSQIFFGKTLAPPRPGRLCAPQLRSRWDFMPTMASRR